jgi:YggT family protein
MHALLNFIGELIWLYTVIIIAAAVVSWLIVFEVVNRRNRAVYVIGDTLNRLTEPALRPIRRRLPDMGGIDISPVVLIIGLYFVRNVVIYDWLWRLF